jgi:hypothetical protein
VDLREPVSRCIGIDPAGALLNWATFALAGSTTRAPCDQLAGSFPVVHRVCSGLALSRCCRHLPDHRKWQSPNSPPTMPSAKAIGHTPRIGVLPMARTMSNDRARSLELFIFDSMRLTLGASLDRFQEAGGQMPCEAPDTVTTSARW